MVLSTENWVLPIFVAFRELSISELSWGKYVYSGKTYFLRPISPHMKVQNSYFLYLISLH